MMHSLPIWLIHCFSRSAGNELKQEFPIERKASDIKSKVRLEPMTETDEFPNDGAVPLFHNCRDHMND
jgi:hypothetical protein